MADDKVFSYARPGFTFDVYPNRIDLSERKLMSTAKSSIVLRNVTDVQVGGIPPTLKITTTDKKTLTFQLGTKNEEARQAIVSVL